MGLRRYLCCRNQNVLAESVLMALIHNIKKFHRKIKSNKTETHVYLLKKMLKFSNFKTANIGVKSVKYHRKEAMHS